MRVSCLQENLNRGLSIVGRAVATRTTLPITQNVLMVTDESRLKLSATNLEIGVSTWVRAKVEEEGALSVPARLLSEFVNSLPAEQIDLQVAPRPRGLSLKCNRFEARINGTDAEEFPPIPTVEGGITAKISPSTLRHAINHVVFAAATEDSRPVLTGVKMEIERDRFTLAAADGFRLAVQYGQLLEPVAEEISIIVPAKTLTELNRLIGEQKEPVEMTVTAQKSQIFFRLQNAEMISQLVQGTFPNYSQLIPQSSTTKATVDLQEFQRATKTAAIFARDGNGIVRLQMFPEQGSSGRMTVSAQADEVGDNQGETDAKVVGEEARIAFNSKYLSDLMAALADKEISLETTSSSSPGVFRPVGSDTYVHVIMPMFVQW